MNDKAFGDSATLMQVGGAVLLFVTACLIGSLVWFTISPKDGYDADHKKLKFGMHAATAVACLAGGVALMVFGSNDTKHEETKLAIVPDTHTFNALSNVPGQTPLRAIGDLSVDGALCVHQTSALWNNQGMDSTSRCCPSAGVTVIDGKTWCTALRLNDPCMYDAQCGVSSRCVGSGTVNGVCKVAAAANTLITGKMIKLNHKLESDGNSLPTQSILIDAFDLYGTKITSGVYACDQYKFTQLVLTNDTVISSIVITNRVGQFNDRINGCRLVVTNAAGVTTLNTNILSDARDTYTFNGLSNVPVQTPLRAIGDLSADGALCSHQTTALWNNQGMDSTSRCCPSAGVIVRDGKTWCTALRSNDPCMYDAQCGVLSRCVGSGTVNGVCKVAASGNAASSSIPLPTNMENPTGIYDRYYLPNSPGYFEFPLTGCSIVFDSNTGTGFINRGSYSTVFNYIGNGNFANKSGTEIYTVIGNKVLMGNMVWIRQ